ncbi:hypothetical protein FRC18_006252, partial [Serendipita sp. 400]
MDPASIASLIMISGHLANRLVCISDSYRTANRTLKNMISECHVLQAVLQKFKTMSRVGHPERLEQGSTLQRCLEGALNGCMVTLQALQEDIQSLDVELAPASGPVPWHVSLGYTAKFKFLWKEKAMNTFLGQLRNQHSAIQFLLQAYLIEGVDDMQRILYGLRAPLRQIDSDAASLRSRQHRRSQQHRRSRSTLGSQGRVHISPSDSSFFARDQSSAGDHTIENASESINRQSGAFSHNTAIRPTTIIEEASEAHFPVPPPPPASVPLSNGDYWTLSITSQISYDDAVMAIRELEEMVGDDGINALNLVLKKKNCDIMKVKKMLIELRSFGQFDSAMLTLQNLKGNLPHTLHFLAIFREFGTEIDYKRSLDLLKSNSYDLLSTQRALEELKSRASTPNDFSWMLHLFSTKFYNIVESQKILESIRTKWTEGPGDYSCVLGFLDYNDYDVQLTTSSLARLVGTKKAQKEVQSLRYSVAVHLLVHNNYELDQTITEIEYLCDPSCFAGAPVISLKTLRGAKYDIKQTMAIFSWLRQVYDEHDAQIRALEENEFRVDGIRSSFKALHSMLYDEQNVKPIAEVFQSSDYNTKKLFRQHEWAQELIDHAPEAQAILRIFIRRGWSISRLKRLLGVTDTERIDSLHLIGVHEEVEIDRSLEKINNALEGFKEKTLKSADSLFRKLSFGLDVVSHLQRMRDVAQDEWGMLLLLA